MGGAQPLAVTGNGGVALCVEVDPWRAQRRLDHGYLDEIADSLDDGIARVEAAKAAGRALSVAVVANCADVLPELVRRGWAPDVVTDQTSAHDALRRLRPERDEPRGGDRAAPGQAGGVRRALPRGDGRALPRDGRPASGPGRSCSTTATGCAVRPRTPASPTRSPTRASCSPTSGRCSRAAPDRSGGRACRVRPPTSRRPTRRCSRPSPTTTACSGGCGSPPRRSRARGCRRASAGSATASGTSPARRSTTWSGRGAVTAPIVIGRDHLDAGLGGLAGAGDRGHARRLGRRRRLADPQRAGQHRVGRVLGVGAPRRRSRHRQVDPRRRRWSSPTAPMPGTSGSAAC